MKSRNPVDPVAIEQGQGRSAKRGGALDEPFRQRRAVEKRKCRRCVEFDVHRRVASSLQIGREWLRTASEETEGTGFTTEERSRSEWETHGENAIARRNRSWAHRALRGGIARGRRISSTMWIVRVLVIRRPLAISRRPTGRRAPSNEILSVRLPLVPAPFLRGEFRYLRHFSKCQGAASQPRPQSTTPSRNHCSVSRA